MDIVVSKIVERNGGNGMSKVDFMTGNAICETHSPSYSKRLDELGMQMKGIIQERGSLYGEVWSSS
jgi:hypothetical protein